MSRKTIVSFVGIFIAAAASVAWFGLSREEIWKAPNQEINPEDEAGPGASPHPLTIEAMRDRDYPGSDIVVEQTLTAKPNYGQYVVSYLSDDFKVYALLTVPKGEELQGGWPAIIFNHGSIPPAQYQTAERYAAYVDYFARRGYVVFKSDYRGHGESEGDPDGGWYSPSYVTDILNAVSSVQKLPYINPEKIGMWGHSMGGHLTIASMVVSPDIKVGVVWAGLTATHDELFEAWRNRIRRLRNNNPAVPSPYSLSTNRRQELINQYGTWQENPEFWQSVAPTSYLADLSGPVQLHHGLADERVPVLYSENLKQKIERAGGIAELYTYRGANHNLSQAFGAAMARSVAFFDQYLK